jgi:phospholipase/lecithinase/hemolysin/uncharacterized protein YhjY with autotransporter beta-barrel domain
MQKIKKTVLLIFGVLLTWQNVYSDGLTFPNIYNFGDSLSDMGNIQNPPGFPAVQTPLTNDGGQVWTVPFANLMGNTATRRGVNYFVPPVNTPTSITTNYALAGATTETITAVEFLTLFKDRSILTETEFNSFNNAALFIATEIRYFDTLPSGAPLTPVDLLRQQQLVQRRQLLAQRLTIDLPKLLLASPNKLDSNALYTYWGGGNDYLNGDTNTVAIVDRIISSTALLRLAGAKNIILINLPNFDILNQNLPTLGLIGVRFIRGANRGQKIPGTLSEEFNNELLKRVQRLNYPVLVFDFNTLFKNITSDLTKFGFADLSELTRDRIHPTSKGHKIIAQALALNYLSPPRTVNSMYTITSDIIKNIDQGITQQIERTTYANPKLETFIFGQLGYNKSSTVDDNISKSVPSNISVGIKNTISSNFVLGAAISQHQQFAKQAIHSFWATGQTFSGFFGMQYKYGYFRTTAQIGRINFSSIQRKFSLGSADIITDGKTTGWHVSSNIQGGLHYTVHDLQIGPFVELQASQMRINPYSERETTGTVNSLDLDIHRQKSHMTLGGVGARIAYRLQHGLANYLINTKISHFFTLDKHITDVDYNPSTQPGTRASFSIKPNEAFMKFEAMIAYAPIRKNAINFGLGYTFINGKFSTIRNFITLDVNFPIG